MRFNTIQLSLLITLLLSIGIFITLLTPLKNVALLTPTINDIDPVAFQEEYAKNPDDYIFIDVRSLSSYNAIHAEGSISMPLHTLYDEHWTLPKTGKKIVLICSLGRAAGVGYHYLEHHGFFNIYRIEGGIEAWQSTGLPVSGNKVFSQKGSEVNPEQITTE